MVNHAGFKNIHHAMSGKCEDPDCEIHNPCVIEDEGSRLTAMAWFIAGGERMTEVMADHINEIFADRDARLDFLRFDYNHDDTIEFYPPEETHWEHEMLEPTVEEE
jgi:hypothetical protein